MNTIQVHGPALRCVRRSARRTLAQLAQRAGVSVSFLAAVERGTRRGVSDDVFRAICDELAIDDQRALQLWPYGIASRMGDGGSSGTDSGTSSGTVSSSTTRVA